MASFKKSETIRQKDPKRSAYGISETLSAQPTKNNTSLSWESSRYNLKFQPKGKESYVRRSEKERRLIQEAGTEKNLECQGLFARGAVAKLNPTSTYRQKCKSQVMDDSDRIVNPRSRLNKMARVDKELNTENKTCLDNLRSAFTYRIQVVDSPVLIF